MNSDSSPDPNNRETSTVTKGDLTSFSWTMGTYGDKAHAFIFQDQVHPLSPR